MKPCKALSPILVGVWLLAACVSPGLAEEPPASSILFILDCSGSMWGRIDGEPKISIAKSVLAALLDEVDANLSLGLMAYGHRKKGDCGDIELVAKPGASRQKLGQSVKALSAKGKTPIANALARAGDLLGSGESPGTVVLISDGMETCGGDPCQLAAKLRKQGVSFVIHGVGFDVSGQAAEQLRCIANAAGGRYFAADNLAQLKQALGRISASVAEKEPLPAPPRTAEKKPAKSRSKRRLLAGPGKVELALADWVKAPRYWAVVDPETGEEKARTNGRMLRVKPGQYQICWRQSEHGHRDLLLNEVVRVRSGKTVTVTIDTGLRLTAPESVPPPKWWALVEPGTNQAVVKVFGSLKPQVVPAGRYALWWRQDEHKAKTAVLGPVSVAPDTLNHRRVDHGINLRLPEWLGEETPKSYQLIDETGKGIGQWSLFGPQLAPPGRYTLVLRQSEHHHSDLVWGPITVPEHGFADILLNSGVVFLHAEDAPPPRGIYFVNLDTETEYALKQTWTPAILPPGRYRLDWKGPEHGSKRQNLVEEFAVEPGVVLELEL